MKSKLGVTLMILGAMLVIAALSLAVFNIHADREAEKNSMSALVKLEEEITQRSETNNTNIELNVSNKSLNETDTLDAIMVKNKSYIGIIDIPAINIKLPVLSEWNYDNLKIAPCRYSGTIGDSMILAAHNYSGHFGKLKNLILDDEVYFIDVNGKVYDFYVDYIEIIDGNSADKMLAGDWDLSMFTCTFDGTERVTIRCKKNT